MTQQSDSTIPQEEQLTITLTTSPRVNGPLYMAGNFNHWQADDERFRLEKNVHGVYRLRIANRESLPDQLEHKYTLG